MQGIHNDHGKDKAGRRAAELRRAVRWSRPFDLFLPLCAAAVVYALAPDALKPEASFAVGVATAGLRYLYGGRFLSGELPRVLRTADRIERAKRSSTGDASVLARLPVPVMAVDATQTVQVISPPIVGLLEREVLGQHITTVFRSPVLLEAVDDALSYGVTAELEFTARRPHERVLGARVSALFPDAEPENRVAAILLEDLTRLRRSEETRMDFVANASHELRTPLASIGGFVETLRGPARDDEAARERFLGIIARETARMTRLVNDLLSLSRIEIEENVVPTERQDLCAILTEVEGTMRPMAEQASIDLTVRVHDKVSEILGVRDELSQVVVNLIENALKYGGGAPVTVDLSAVDRGETRGVSLVVSDRGPGIDRNLIPRLTERFFRVDVGESRTLGGTGLGLAIVKHIVSRHRGTLDIRSEKGQGATFALWFPLADEHITDVAAQ